MALRTEGLHAVGTGSLSDTILTFAPSARWRNRQTGIGWHHNATIFMGHAPALYGVRLMPLYWDASADLPFIAIRGAGEVGWVDIKSCLSALKGNSIDGRAKIFDLGDAELLLSPEDLQFITLSLRRYCGKATPGPIAFVVTTTENFDMALLVKGRVNSDRLRVFPSRGKAIAWLEQELSPVIPFMRRH